jgi:hypothetical protein
MPHAAPRVVFAALALPALAAEGPSPWPVTFVDVAATAGLTQPTVYGGVDDKRFILETNGSGVAFTDLDGDGWIDALLLSGTRLAEGARREASFAPGEAPVNRLYRNRRDGTFDDVSRGSGLDFGGWASGVCAGDYDNDGRVDLFLTAYGRSRLMRNLGGLRFEDVTAAAGLARGEARWASGCSFLDYDRDGRLDLFVAHYLSFDLETAPEKGQGPNCQWKGVPVNCGPKGLAFDTPLLFHNDGGGRFSDASARSGVARVTSRYAMTAAAADLDGDGWVDLYVACDSTAAVLLRNNRDGTFTDVALESGAALSEYGLRQAGMGLGVADFDADGRLDILKTHFAEDIPALYRAVGDGLFEDVASASGLGAQNRHVQWGAALADLDNDAWPDVFYVTGNVYPEIERRLSQYPHQGPRIVFRNRAGRGFEDVSAHSGPGATAPRSSRGAAFGDYDNDGDIDVLVMNMNAPPSLLRNDLSGGGSWLQVRLEGTRSNRMGLGATVWVTVDGRRLAQAALSQSSYYSVNDQRLHFGLGTARRAERVDVRWPDGATETFGPFDAKRVVTLKEGTGRAPAPR